MLSDWIGRPHWQEWWGPTDEEVDYLRDMISGRDSTRPFVILCNGDPLGYVQVWRIADNLFEPWLTEAPWMPMLPPGAVGVDISLADAELLGRGLGSAVLTAFVRQLRDEGHHEIWIDPDIGNARAIRAYEKAGFRAVPGIEDPTGACLLMRHEVL